MHFTSIPLEDDSTDRLHHYLTSIFLFISLLISSKRQYIGSPISCWCPKTFTKAHVEYAENFCWTSNTYYIPNEKNIPSSFGERKDGQIIYYQWVPCLLLAQIIFFQIPNCLWVAWYPTTGIQVRAILETAKKAANIDPQFRQRIVRQIGRHLKECLIVRKSLYGGTLCALYLLIKVFYLCNVVVQIIILVSFLGGGVTKESIIPNFDANSGSASFHAFPQTTLCDITIRKLGNLHRYTVQCILPINRVNEKIYLAMRLWFIILSLLTLISLFRWSMRLLFVSTRRSLAAELIEQEEGEQLNPETSPLLVAFTDDVLHQDGVLMLLLLGHNAGKLIASEIATWMWLDYRAGIEQQNIQSQEGTGQPNLYRSVSRNESAPSNISVNEESKSEIVVPYQLIFS